MVETKLNTYLEEIDRKKAGLEKLSDDIWEFAETAFSEHNSVKALADFLRAEGFSVTEHAYGVETAFTAEFGQGRPRIGILGEFDALSGLSQKAGLAEKEALIPGANGHGCGHNLLGAGSVAAALAVKKYLEDGHQGTVVYYGCPGEEGGSGKAFMARGGAFKDLDCALTWHPGVVNAVSKDSSLANFQVLYSFKGISAHAAGCPEMGRSALDGLELMNVGTNFLREHMLDKARVHYAIIDTGGYSPNVVQSEAKAIYLIRAPKVGEALELYKRVDKIAQGAALMTETEVEKTLIKSCANLVSNRVLEQVLDQAMTDIGVPSYTEEEYEKAAAYTATAPAGADRGYRDLIEDHLDPENISFLRKNKNRRLYDFIVPYEKIHLVKSGGGSTDVGDVSWMCPTAQFNTATWAPETPGQSWQVVSQGKSETAHKGMLYAGKIIALAAMRLMENQELIRAAREEFDEEFEGQTYVPIPDEVKPRAISDIQ